MKKPNGRRLSLSRESLAQLAPVAKGGAALTQTLLHCPYTHVGPHGCQTHVPHCTTA